MRTRTAKLWAWVALVMAIACGGDGEDDAADASADAVTDAGTDAGTDASTGAGTGTGTDAADVDAALPSTKAEGICTRDGACEESVEVEPGQHVEGDIDYGALPPAGGPHNPCWGDFGIHDELFPPENWVHNLEHGAVVFLHACPEGCADALTALEGLVAERSWAILSPAEGMDTRFAVVAWGYRLMTDELDLDAFADFYDAHADQAPESVSSGKPAGCP